jgi:hypothetical protein
MAHVVAIWLWLSLALPVVREIFYSRTASAISWSTSFLPREKNVLEMRLRGSVPTMRRRQNALYYYRFGAIGNSAVKKRNVWGAQFWKP